ncbi:hypothetical protein HanRHA438_Chr05g0241601 [Helianthus annuus]|nr:hypothetical protein HanRHA438_Chr05g0241601 [Helianthus annuus]
MYMADFCFRISVCYSFRSVLVSAFVVLCNLGNLGNQCGALKEVEDQDLFVYFGNVIKCN